MNRNVILAAVALCSLPTSGSWPAPDVPTVRQDRPAYAGELPIPKRKSQKKRRRERRRARA